MARKRQSLTLTMAADAKLKVAGQPNTRAAADEMITTAIHIRRDTWDLLRSAAFQRARSRGGRASVSRLIGEIVEKGRGQLEAEIVLDS